MKILGYHFLVDYILQEDSKINNLDYFEQLLKKACKVDGFIFFKIMFKKYKPYGFSLIGFIGESHFSFHNLPEHNFLSVDIFSCINEQRMEQT